MKNKEKYAENRDKYIICVYWGKEPFQISDFLAQSRILNIIASLVEHTLLPYNRAMIRTHRKFTFSLGGLDQDLLIYVFLCGWDDRYTPPCLVSFSI
jgi:hypothetical protein